MAFTIELTDLLLDELRAIRAFDRRRIIDEIKQQLRQEPMSVTRNRKCVDGLRPTFEHRPPIWELRVGEYRVFYDVDEPAQTVYVRAVRQKKQGQTTEDILHERSDD